MIKRRWPSSALHTLGFLTLAVVLASCGGGSGGITPTPDPDPGSGDGGGTSSKVVSGTIENWTGQTAVLKAEFLTSGPLPVLTEGPINPDGTFSLTLPGADVIGQYLEPWTGTQCDDVEGGSGSIEITPGELELSPPLRLDVYASSDSQPIGTLAYTVSSGATQVEYVYSASDGTITGSCTFTFEDGNGAEVSNTDAYNVNLAAGWNELIVEYTFPEEGFGVADSNTYTGNVPSGAFWSYYEYESPPPPCDSNDPECESPPPPPPPPAPPPA